MRPSKKIALLILMMILASLLIYGLSETVTTFYGHSSAVNLSIVGPSNETLYLRVPKYVYIQNITVTIKGMDILT